MKKEIKLEDRTEIVNKIKKAYKGYDDIISNIVKNGILYYSAENDCVAWVSDTGTFFDFLNLGEIDTSYYVYRFAIIDNKLVTIRI